MTNERLKQEAALRVLMLLTPPAVAEDVIKMLGLPSHKFLAALARFEDSTASRVAAISEAVAEAFVAKFGPDTTEVA